MALPREAMPVQDATQRIGNFQEVNLGLDRDRAIREAKRCLNCKTRPCMVECPVRVHIPEFLARIAEENFEDAAKILRRDNTLPAITGRVCPQERQCEAACVRGNRQPGQSVAIGWLERFIADWAQVNLPQPAPKSVHTGKRVAVVGSGPGGLTAAGELARRGHDVTIFEALHAPGGVLRYGIPEFRLPKAIVDAEIENLRALGVKIECNVVVGRTITLEKIRKEFDACFIANGAGLPTFLNVPGENLKGVYSANEYLTRVNLMGAWRDDSRTPVIRGKTAVVFGGGNVAMDAVRTAKRMGSERAILVYRRSREELPARAEEIHHAEQEGVEFLYLAAPLELQNHSRIIPPEAVGNDRSWVRAVRLQRMELGNPDASGRRKPIPVPGSEFELPCDLVIVAIGTSPNPLLTASCPELKTDADGNILVDDNLMTSLPNVFAGGDIVRGGATVILAMGDGSRAATVIHACLTNPDKVARFLDDAGNKKLTKLHDYRDRIRSIASITDPDRKRITRIAAAFDDNIVHIWDAVSDEELQTLSGHTGMVTAIAFRPDGKQVATTSIDSTTRVWDVASGEELHLLRDNIRCFVNVAFSQNGKYVATTPSHKHNTTHIWDIAHNKELIALRGRLHNVIDVAISNDGNFIATASRDKNGITTHLWDINNGEEVGRLRNHKLDVNTITFKPDRKSVV